MGQANLKRTYFKARATVTTPQNDDKQLVDFTGYFEIGDTVDVIDVDAAGNIISTLADNLTVQAIIPGQALVLSSSVDTTLATVTAQIVCQQIDDGQDAIDRLYRRRVKGPVDFDLTQNIVAQRLNYPIAGQTAFEVNDVSFFRVGDQCDILADEGLIQSLATIVAVNQNADASSNRSTLVFSGVIDTSTFTSPFILNRTITLDKAVRRNQEIIDGIDQPIENQFLGAGNALDTAFEASGLFVANSSKILLDGKRLRLGIAGTRASHTQGAGNSQLIVTSMLLGLLGNEVEIQVTAGAGLGVTVTKSFNASSSAIITGTTQYRVQVNNNAGAATAAQIANAINSDASAKRIMQVRYGGTGAGTVAAFGPTNLTGGLDNGTGDYAELEQIFENTISGTGFKWVSLHIRPNERNRLSGPPESDEEMVADYRQARDNVDR